MTKWYENKSIDEDIILSSRVRLARNLRKYPFSTKLPEDQSYQLLKEVTDAVVNDRNPLSDYMKVLDMKSMDTENKHAIMEKHIISPVLMKKKEPCCAIVKDDETVSIMVNEEDHIRIQSVFPGDEIKDAWDLADKMDNLIEETLDYAFDYDFGYLTTCPTNAGTGMRASFMAHLPILTMTGQIKHIIQAISKFGITVRGIYGEGTDSLGNIYQLSNQVTLGQSEQEMIQNLINVTNQVMEKEQGLREKLMQNSKNTLSDKVYRSYGTLTYAREMNASEAMNLLSDVRLGYMLGLLDEKQPSMSIYQIMMNIQPGNLKLNMANAGYDDSMDIYRAEYLRNALQS